MKKLSKLLTLVLVFCLVLTGCGPVYREYTKKYQDFVDSAQAVEADYKFNVNVKGPVTGVAEEPFSINIPGQVKTYQTKTQAEIVFSYDMGQVFDSIFEALGADQEEAQDFKDQAKEEIKEELGLDISEFEFKFFVDGTDLYMPSSYAEIMGLDLKTDAEYIKVNTLGSDDIDLDSEQIQSLSEELVKDLNQVLEDYDALKDMYKEGQKYSYFITVDQGKDEAINFVKFTQENIDKLIDPIYRFIEKSGLAKDQKDLDIKKSKAEIKAAIADIDVKELDKNLTEVTQGLKGSNMSMEAEFKGKSIDSKLKYKLVIEGLLDIDMTMEGTESKAQERKIQIPTSSEEISMDQLFKANKVIDAEKIEGPIIDIFINDAHIEFKDSLPKIIDGRTMVPLRTFFISFSEISSGDFDIEWNEETRTVKAQYEDTSLELTIDSNIVKVNGEEKEIDVPATIIDDRTYVPLRFIAEQFGFEVNFTDLMEGDDQAQIRPYMHYMIELISEDYDVEVDKDEDQAEKEAEKSEEKVEEEKSNGEKTDQADKEVKKEDKTDNKEIEENKDHKDVA